MTFQALIARILARLEKSFEDSRGRDASELARGEFISTLIIDHGAAREAETRRPPRG